MNNVIQGKFSKAKTHTKQTCQVAYALNFDQPVMCTIISDQPFFYFDDEIIEDELDCYDDMDLDAMDAELEKLKACIDHYEEVQIQRDQEKQNDPVCDRFDENTDFYTTTVNKDIVSQLKDSRTAAAYLDMAETRNTKILFDDAENASVYNSRDNTITIGTSQSHNEALLSLAQTLRTAWQDAQGILIDPNAYGPDDAITINRLQTADAHVAMTRIAWELQLAGHKDIWSYLNRGSSGDIARSLSREAHRDFRSLNNGRASTAAFEAWFLSERCRKTDDVLIRSMLGAQTKNKSDHMAINMHDYIFKLGAVPFGENYLKPHVEIIAEDDIFNEVRDRSNANFLWFIKFEQSFQETEQFLQTDHVISDTARTAGPINNTRDLDHGQQTPCDIVHLFPQTADRQRGTNGYARVDRSRPFSGKCSGAKIIDFSAKF